MIRTAVANPKLTCAIAAGLVLLCLPALYRLQLHTDGRALVPRNDPVVQRANAIQRRFGAKDTIAITITTAPGETIYNRETLRLVVKLSQAAAGLSGIEPRDVVSLATEQGDRVRPGTLEFRRFLDPFPRSAIEFERLRGDIEAATLLRGTLVSYDEMTAAILIGVDPDDDRNGIVAAIHALVDAEQGPRHRFRVVGAPVAESQLGLFILADLIWLVPIVIAVLSLLLFLLTGNIWAVVLGGAEVLATLVTTFAVMSLAGVPVYLTTAVLPVTLTAIAAADEIHIFGRYLHKLAVRDSSATQSKRTLILQTMAEMRMPVILTSLTTAIAFLSFAASPIEPVRYFGIFQCFGVLVAMAWSLLVTPAALSLIDEQSLFTVGELRARVARWLQPLVGRASGSPATVLAGIAAAMLLAVFGASRLTVQDSWIDGFGPASTFYEGTAFVDANFHGTHLLQIEIEAADASASLHRPAVLEVIGELESFARSLDGIGGVLGPHSHLQAMSYLLSGRQEQARGIPHTEAEIEAVLRYSAQVRGEHRIAEVFDAQGRAGLMTAFLRHANFQETTEILSALNAFAKEHLEPEGLSLAYAGDIGISQAMIPAIVQSQVRSVLLTLVGIILVASVLTRSLLQGALCALPACLASLLLFGAMGFLGIPLGVATSMFCAITLGIGVDYAVHLTVEFRRQCELAEPTKQALSSAVARSGYTIFVDAVCMAGGFATLTFSQVPANARLGAMVTISITGCFVMTFLVLPALMSLLRPWGAASKTQYVTRVGSR